MQRQSLESGTADENPHNPHGDIQTPSGSYKRVKVRSGSQSQKRALTHQIKNEIDLSHMIRKNTVELKKRMANESDLREQDIRIKNRSSISKDDREQSFEMRRDFSPSQIKMTDGDEPLEMILQH